MSRAVIATRCGNRPLVDSQHLGYRPRYPLLPVGSAHAPPEILVGISGMITAVTDGLVIRGSSLAHICRLFVKGLGKKARLCAHPVVPKTASTKTRDTTASKPLASHVPCHMGTDSVERALRCVVCMALHQWIRSRCGLIVSRARRRLLACRAKHRPRTEGGTQLA